MTRMTINELGTAKQIFEESDEEHSFLAGEAILEIPMSEHGTSLIT
jgi:hypothetical protein